jgi:hypothetical protein
MLPGLNTIGNAFFVFATAANAIVKFAIVHNFSANPQFLVLNLPLRPDATRYSMRHDKKMAPGENDRIAALINNGVPATFLDEVLGNLRNGRDDFLDACAAAWTAR